MCEWLKQAVLKTSPSHLGYSESTTYGCLKYLSIRVYSGSSAPEHATKHTIYLRLQMNHHRILAALE